MTEGLPDAITITRMPIVRNGMEDLDQFDLLVSPPVSITDGLPMVLGGRSQGPGYLNIQELGSFKDVACHVRIELDNIDGRHIKQLGDTILQRFTQYAQALHSGNAEQLGIVMDGFREEPLGMNDLPEYFRKHKEGNL
jgi:hypothetical protein